MVFEFNDSSCIPSNISAQEAGEVCEKLADEGRLTAKDLVDESRQEEAPLHPAFEWDDSIAGERWREHQAGHIIRAIITRETPKQEPTRAFFHITTGKSSYVPISVIVNSPDSYEMLLQQATKEFQAYQRKYKNIKELDPVFNAFEQIKF